MQSLRRFLHNVICALGRHEYRLHYCELCLPQRLYPVEAARFVECVHCGRMQRRSGGVTV